MGDFPNIFKQLRLRDHLSQQELADKLGIAKSTVSMYENGRREPDLETLEQIADLFNVDMDYLVGRKKTSNEYTFVAATTSYDDVEALIARNGKEMSKEQKLRLIKLLSEFE